MAINKEWSIIKYNNDMNKVAFHKFNAVELNLFYTICSMLKEKGTSELTLSFDEIKKMSQTRFKNEKEFIDRLNTTYEKLLGLIFGFEDEEQITKFVFFTHYQILTKEKTLSIKLNKDFAFILNNLTKNFTVFELNSFSQLSSGYSKNLFRLIKQYKSTGFYIVEIKEFRRLMDIPDSYKMTNIDMRVINPALKELSPLFKKLKVEKIKSRSVGRGGTVTHLKFTFQSDSQSKVENQTLKRESSSEILKESGFSCPVCQNKLYEINGLNGCFYGHKDYLNNNCKATFNTVSDVLGYKDIYKEKEGY